MAVTIQDIDILKEYLVGVLNRADHHASNVNEIALAIVGGIIWKQTGNIKVMSREGEMKNVLWLNVGDKKYCFVYNHENEGIEVKEGSIQGNVIQIFNNKTGISSVKDFFASL